MVAIVQKNVAAAAPAFRSRIDATSPADIPPLVVTYLNSLPVTSTPVEDGLISGQLYWNGGVLQRFEP